MRIIVLGGGRVGGAIARDLHSEGAFDVRVADRDTNRLAELEQRWGLRGERVDFSLPSTVERAVSGADLAISAVPGFLGHRTLRTIIGAGVNVIDIAFFPEDPFRLDSLARERGVIAIVDCGVAPGLSNLLVGRTASELDRVEQVAIYVGGLPSDPKPPYEYRAVFSPVDVIEEYTRPARLVVDGRIVTKPALSDVEQLEFPNVGLLEAFVTDGLRTLLDTIACPQMVEKTLRYPGHAEKIALLRETGFLSVDPLRIDDTEIRPIDVTTALLFPIWQLRPGEQDVTVLRVVVEGVRGERRVRPVFDMVDQFDRQTGITSMARTTVYTATATARALAAGKIARTGVLAPEMLASQPGCVEFILARLRERGIEVVETTDRRSP